MPGALKARETDRGSAVETTTGCLHKMDKSVVEVVDRAESGEASKGKRKKRRKKRRRLNSSDVGNGGGVVEGLDRVVRDAVDLSSVVSSSSHCTGKLSRVTEQERPREFPEGDDLETSVAVKVTGHMKLNKKKRKQLEEEFLKERNETTSFSVATTEARTADAHSRVWKYVCNRAVLVNSKFIRDSEGSSIKSALPGYEESTVVTEIEVAGKKIVVTNTKEGAVAQEWLNRQKGTVFGLDAEWRPSFKKGTEHKVALLQICGESECLIVQMLYLDVIPRGLVNFLKDPAIKFPGVGIQGDAVKLKRDWGLECNGTVDLTSLAATILGRPELKFTGLKALAKVVMDYDMAKPKRVTMSNWAKPVLDKVQVEYASLDAWVSYAIHQKLFQPTTT